MTTGMAIEKLYTAEILGLAVELAQFPLLEDARLRGIARSPSCGSSLEVSLTIDALGLVDGLGMRVSACAIGQASAAIFARHALGMNMAAISSALRELGRWLSEDSDNLPWPDLRKIERARAYPARHGAILLPWRAAQQALSKEQAER
ncbi:iron-sulfur cluster assembly scaffold protein [Altererythrobacter sp.]|nr:iron-sulfur cluster assembly scaffold protein [Altererythrobacter sp.]